ncbi:MAG: DUF3858 domain-containing protein [Prevotellaceae bacterium]|jgi:hypothetical protein|nr:DUF3858 domain-containing protein [Prevotellaceae bacterium]
MKRISVLSVLTFLASIAFAQDKQSKYSFDFGKVNNYELTMTEYEKDKDADAIVIYELGDFYFSGNEIESQMKTQLNFFINKNHKIKIKILKESGTKNAAFSIPLYKETEYVMEKLYINKATVYNLNENNQLEKTEFSEKNITEAKLNENYIVKKFTLPNVHAGSVIELEYTIVTPFHFSFEWEFQKRIPVVYSNLRYRAIPYYSYVYMLKGAANFDEFNSRELIGSKVYLSLEYREKEFVMGMKNLPAFKDDDYITSPKDYMVAINFQLSEKYYPTGGSDRIMSTWKDLCNDFLKYDDFGKYIKRAEKEAKNILPTLNLTGQNQEQTLKTLVNYVKSNYSWNGVYGKYIFSRMPEFLKKKNGNDANLNLFLTGLLKAAAIDATPVVLSTRENGTVSKQYPFDIFFNYVIVRVKIEDSIYYIDATEPTLYFNELPERCLNVDGLAVKPKSEEWVRIEEKEVSILYKEFTIKPLPLQQKMNVDVKFVANTVEAYDLRQIHRGKDINLINYLNDKYNANVSDIKVNNLLEFDKPLEFSFSETLPLQNEGQKIVIHPFCNMSLSENPFRQQTRSLPVDLIYRRGYKYRSVIEIPQGYSVGKLPEPVKTANDFYSLSYSINQTDNRIEIESVFELGKSIYQASEYGYMKSILTTAIKKHSETITLLMNNY